MEHEVFVPVPVERLREALADPARVARAVPGLQQDAGTAPVSGRLKVRVGSHSVTYRGTLRVTGQDDGSYAVEGDGTEARGSGSVKLALTLSLRSAEGGSTLVFGGTATADGRVTELPPDAVASASTRLLNRFAENLADADADADAGADASGGSVGASGEPEAEASGEVEESSASAAPEAAPESAPAADAEAEIAPPEGAQGSEPVAAEEPSVFETEVPPPSLTPFAEGDFEGGFQGGFEEEDTDAAPPAEAAHARRTMIGRSAEEVDHAPPRGRYAPVPAPEAVSGRAALRWAAPAAALVVASAIVVSRVLRKRR
ncbi:carbon monoxide dehydrogenase [Streptomyces sp. HC44]|uniref:Carbon monoxide dehydrogenase n=1 Tax=Streptomyces scabichelini TaxID=2711217 RepID=A0A6G4VN02_9ACTN|nr:SRPBCC domain-containing protein [Streptomyces scabichelini]NGO15476.1 carbon monoxide dehydrogenase [Streptomyces scabichelini]